MACPTWDGCPDCYLADHPPGPQPGCDCESCWPEPIVAETAMLAESVRGGGPDDCERCGRDLGARPGRWCAPCRAFLERLVVAERAA